MGDKSLGIAISDSLHTIAQGIDSVKFSSTSPEEKITFVQKLISEYQVGKIVVGLPVDLRGSEGEQAKKVKKFVAELKKQVDLPLVYVDERFTSIKAEKLLREGRVGWRKRRKFKDKLAATILLQDYLDYLNSFGKSENK